MSKYNNLIHAGSLLYYFVKCSHLYFIIISSLLTSITVRGWQVIIKLITWLWILYSRLVQTSLMPSRHRLRYPKPDTRGTFYAWAPLWHRHRADWGHFTDCSGLCRCDKSTRVFKQTQNLMLEIFCRVS